jgi:hypothetical protein
MRSDRRAAWAALFLLTIAAPATAGVVYIPVPPSEGGATLDVLAFNRDPQVGRRYTARLLPAGTDGVTAGREGSTVSTVHVVRWGTGVLALGSATPSGLLEVSSAPQLSFEARLRPGAAGGEALSLPVIDSANRVDAGDFAELLGLERTAGAPGAAPSLRADVGITNLGHAAAVCTARLNRAGGGEVGQRATFAMAPLSFVHFEDALAAFGVGSATTTTLRVACDQPFHAFAVQRGAAGRGLRVVLPAASGRSDLALPGEVSTGHPPGSLVFTWPGALHTPRPDKPTQIFEVDVPTGRSWRRLEVSFDYRHAGWSHTPDGNHSLFWLHRGRWLQSRWADNIFAFANAFGGNKSEVKVLTNVDAGKARQVWKQSHALLEGHTYHVNYVYDTETEVLRLTLTDKATGGKVVDITGDTYGKPIVADSQGAFFLYFGHQDDTGIAPERPSYGSTWSDAELVFVP